MTKIGSERKRESEGEMQRQKEYICCFLLLQPMLQVLLT